MEEIRVFEEKYEQPKMATKTKPIEYTVDAKGCWNTEKRHRNNDRGYSNVKRNGRMMRTHRYVFEQVNGEIPEGMVVRHKCDNRRCINPEHLELGTQYDNVQDTVNRGRTAKGQKRDSGLFDREKYFYVVNSLKSGKLLKDTAKELGIDVGTLREVAKNRHWSCKAFDPDRDYEIVVSSNRATGNRSGNAKVTKEVFESILQLTKAGLTQKQIHKETGIGPITVRLIQKGTHWACDLYGKGRV